MPPQIVFVDTPGIFAPRRRLDRAMVETAWGGARDADLVALLVDAQKGIDEDVHALLAKLAEIGRPKILVLNKVDLVNRARSPRAHRRRSTPRSPSSAPSWSRR